MKPPTGKVRGIYVWAKRGEGKAAVESAEFIADYGIRGDAHAGLSPDRQISLFESEVLRELEARFVGGARVERGDFADGDVLVAVAERRAAADGAQPAAKLSGTESQPSAGISTNAAARNLSLMCGLMVSTMAT